MDKEELLKLAELKNIFIGRAIKGLQDSEKADQDVILPGDIIDKKRVDRDRLKQIKKLLVDVSSTIDKIEEDVNKDIVRLQLLIDESYL